MGLRRALALVTVSSVLAASGLGCSTPRTELIVVVDTDLAIPTEADAFRVVVDGPGGRMMTADAPLSAGDPPPRFVGIVPDDRRLGPFVIEASAVLRGSRVVTRTAEVTLEEQRTLQITIFLTRDCLALSCPGQTCSGGACRAIEVDPGELEVWRGPPEHRDGFDGGTSGTDAGAGSDGAVCGVEVCDGVDNDCDGMTDEGFDLTSDPANCGSCGRRCEAPNATLTCTDSDCVITACDPGFDDCDTSVPNGCEADLTLPATCGSCDMRCGRPNRDCCSGVCGRC